MGKDKKKKKDKNVKTQVEQKVSHVTTPSTEPQKDSRIIQLEKQYNDSIKLLKIKHEEYDGIIKEAKMYLEEVKEMHRAMKEIGSVETPPESAVDES